MFSCFCFSAVFCFFAFLLFLLCASVLVYFSAFLLFCFLLFLLFAFPASLLFMHLFFSALPASFLFCFSAFPASLLLCFCAFLLLLFYFFFSSVMCFCCSTSCSSASLLPVFTVLSLVFFPFSFALSSPVCILNETLKTLGEIQRNLKEILIRSPDKKPLHETLNEP